MKRVVAICAFVVMMWPVPSPAEDGAAFSTISLSEGWRVTQDVLDVGEEAGWYQPDFAADWPQIDGLAHLQLRFATNPYFGRNLRYFNNAPWWYRIDICTPAVPGATLKFGG